MSTVSSSLPTEADARRCLAAAAASGTSLYAWCRANDVPSSTLYRWQHRLGVARDPVRLIEVIARPEPARAPTPVSVSAAHYVVSVKDVTITVSDDFADATLARLLAVARAC